jgi:hypothetical protein
MPANTRHHTSMEVVQIHQHHHEIEDFIEGAHLIMDFGKKLTIN